MELDQCLGVSNDFSERNVARRGSAPRNKWPKSPQRSETFGRLEAPNVLCELAAHYSKTDNFRFETMTPGNQNEVSRFYSSCVRVGEPGADLPVLPIIWIPTHECRLRPDRSLPPSPYGGL